MAKTDYHPCQGRKASGSRCHFKGLFRRNGKWYCRMHDPYKKKFQEEQEAILLRTEAQLIPRKELDAIEKMARYFDKHNTLGTGVNVAEVWANTVPRLVQDIKFLRNKLRIK